MSVRAAPASERKRGESASRQQRIDFAVVGGQKCGSSLLQLALARHPAIWMPPGEWATWDHRVPAEDERRDVLGEAPASARVGFKRPSLLTRPGCAERLHAACPGAKTLAVLRDPVARTRSALFHYMAAGRLPVMPVERAVEALFEAETRGRFPALDDVWRGSMMGAGAERHRAAFGDEGFLAIRFDDLVARPAETLARVHVFLGVAPEPRAGLPGGRPHEVVYHPGRLRLRRLRNRFQSRGGPFMRARGRPRPVAVLELAAFAGIDALDRALVAPFVPNRPPAMPRWAIRRLREAFEADQAIQKRALGWSFADAW